MSEKSAHLIYVDTDKLLAAYLIANILSDESRLSVMLAAPPHGHLESRELLAHIAALMESRGQGIPDEELRARIHIAQDTPEQFPPATENVFRDSASQIWFLPGAATSSSLAAGVFDSWMAALPDIKAPELNFILLNDSVLSEERIIHQCESRRLRYRIFRTAFLLGDTPSANADHPVLQFLDIFFSFRKEIEERLPEYFQFRSLRCTAPAQSAFNLMPAEEAAEMMFRISRNPENGGSYDIASCEATPFAEFSAGISMAYGLSLMVARNPGELNAVDTVLNERLSGFYRSCALPRQFNPGAAYQAAEMSPPRISSQKLVAVLETIRDTQEARRAARDQRASSVYSAMAARTITRDGSELKYLVSSSAGTPIIILNALGQGLKYWVRLLASMPDHRFFIWEPRGTFFGPQPFTLQDQVEDLKAILRHEGVDACHLLGWCTGPKVALEFYFQQPRTVASMVFLNGSFKCTGTPRELHSEYERALDSMCQAVCDTPEIAPHLAQSLSSRQEANTADLMDLDSNECALRVLSLINQHLKQDVLAPFRDDLTTMNYARQLLDFWNYDYAPKLDQVNAPVLLLSAEHDQVACPAMIRSIADLLPRASLVHIKGATHYYLYDHPEFVAEMLRKFFKDPGSQVSQAKVQVHEPAITH